MINPRIKINIPKIKETLNSPVLPSCKVLTIALGSIS